MQNAVAFANNDVVVVAWSYGHKLTGCMGFAIYRIDANNKETALPSMAVFPGFKRKAGQTTADFPIQKFYWKDPYARLVADKTGSRKFRYKVVPLEGQPGSLKPMSIGFVISNEVEISPRVGDGLMAYFNRGLISTQRVSNAFKGNPSKTKLLDLVADPKQALRKSLAGDMISALLTFVARTDKGGTLYAALYELGDSQLIDALKGPGKKLHLVLSNSGPSEAQKKNGIEDGNTDSRAALHATARQVFDRTLPTNQIGHNKFVIYVGKNGKARAVLFGSTNWTSTGLCAQTNNTIVSESSTLAARYLLYWKKLAADTQAAAADPKALQAAPLRTWDATSKTIQIDGGAATSWFSPNTPALRKSKTTGEQRPLDMEQVAGLIAGANKAVLFLAFYPGSPSVANWTAQLQKAKKDVFVRGCVTNPNTAEAFLYELKGQTPPKKVKGSPPGKQDPRVIQAQALSSTIPAGWRKELLSAGFAVTHDKIVVIDPFSDDCVVITGSHNLGHKASYNNDENLIIVKGQRQLAQAYATHVLDVYDHFSWRWTVQRDGQAKADTKLEVKPDVWQSRYFDAAGNIKVAQLRFWLGAIPAAPGP